ncbi:uncharacterized protein LOC131028572 isoform X2 [Cryptomeria japonica]|uniref:uncharacterized protein LOC131028572 isoform X2 n=1 Tax=Cryptomeria japonica TaxID=3369 RepID=UPI0025ABFA90|nr:uncharacterized protein LOC131028572 isoform X2 [Cryptomeria japonica]
MEAAIASSSFSCSVSVSISPSRIPFLSTVLDMNVNPKKGVQNLSTSRCSSSKFQSAIVFCNFFNHTRSMAAVFSSNSLTTYRRSVRVYVGRRDEEEKEFGMYPWEASSFNDINNTEERLLSSFWGLDCVRVWPDSTSGPPVYYALQWVQEDTITLFTTEGLMQIGGSVVPRRINNSQEEDYMDPNQGLCLGAIFDIAATNGLDLGRRFCIFGFCRSIEMLSDVVEDTVLEQGGEVVIAEKESKGGLQEKLTMTVAVPLLWGIPPAAERLRFAVRTGGGIVEKIYWQWNF